MQWAPEFGTKLPPFVQLQAGSYHACGLEPSGARARAVTQQCAPVALTARVVAQET